MYLEYLLCGSIIFLSGILGAKILWNPNKAPFLDFIVMSTSFVLGFQPLIIAFFRGGWGFENPWSLQLKLYGAIWLFLIGIISVRIVENRLIYHYSNGSKGLFWLSISRASYVDTKRILVAFLICLIYRIYIATEYGIFFSGSKNEESISSIPYILIAIANIVEIIEWGYGIWASWVIFGKENKYKKILAIFILISLLILKFAEGRRWILSLILQLFAIGILRNNRLTLKIAVSSIIAIILLFFIAFPIFLNVREAYWLKPESGNAIKDIVSTSKYLLDKKSDSESITSTDPLFENIVSRPTVREFVIDILDRQTMLLPMYGKAIKSVFEWGIPRVIFQDKILNYPTEQLIQKYYGLKLADRSMSWVAVGVADFGFFGGFIIGIGIALFCLGLMILAVKMSYFFPFLNLCLLGGLLNIILVFEEAPSKLIVLVRDISFLFIAIGLVKFILSGKLNFISNKIIYPVRRRKTRVV